MMHLNPVILSTANAIADSMSDMPLGERMLLGLRVTVLGMATCFLVLMILWGVLALFRVIFVKDEKKTAATEKSLPAAEPAPLPEPEPEPEQDEGELIAVITAAAYAYLESEAGETAPQTKFRVVSFRKTGVR